MLAVLVVAMGAAVLLQRRLAVGEAGAPLRASRLAAACVAVVALAGFLGAAAGSGSADGQPRRGADTRRLTSFESNRYDYWKVALRMGAHHPLAGEGSSAFRVVWRRERTIDDPALDAHSLVLETFAELGLLGLLALGAFLGGVGWGGRRALLADRPAAVGACAALAALLVHACLDWDWEMPALALPGIVLAGALLASLEAAGAGGPARAGEPAVPEPAAAAPGAA